MLRRVTITGFSPSSLAGVGLTQGSVLRFGSTNSVPQETQDTPTIPHPRVRHLYKEFISLATLHPTFTMEKCRGLIKARFRTNATIPIYNNDHPAVGEEAVAEVNETDGHHTHRKDNPYTPEFQKALAWGRYNLSELEAFYHIHKFRAMRKYDWSAASDRKSADQFIASLDAKRPS